MTVALTACISMCVPGRVVSAASQQLEIYSASVVGANLAPAIRLDPPIVAPSAAPDAAGENRSTCRSDLSGSVMTITIADIGYSCPVYAGGQSMLNSGAVTSITDPAIMSVIADHPGGPGLLWIAGHRVSHGGAFAAVPDLADGAIVTVSDGTFTASYRVVGRVYVGVSNSRVIDAAGNATVAATLDSILRPDHGGNKASRLLLQTCDGEAHRWMIYADLVTG
ncbi:MAG: sortase [Ilumatobacteraceae bacterium]